MIATKIVALALLAVTATMAAPNMEKRLLEDIDILSTKGKNGSSGSGVAQKRLLNGNDVPIVSSSGKSGSSGQGIADHKRAVQDKMNSPVCSTGKAMCCDTFTQGAGTDSIFPASVPVLTGNNCNSIPVLNIIGDIVTASDSQCKSTVMCCDAAGSSGVINAPCTQLNLF